MPIRLSCPSCNTAFGLPELPMDGRAACPRCGDVFAVRTFTEVTGSEDIQPNSAASTRTSLRKTQAKRSVVRVVFVALSMGLLGLAAGLGVYYTRGGGQPTPSSEPESPLTAATPASELSGLGYLPADTNIAFAIQTGPVMAYAARMKQDSREMLIQAGIPAKVFDSFTSFGLTLPQIDHIVGGTCLDDVAFSPRVTLVLVLRKPLVDEDEFLHKLKARKHAGKARYEIEMSGIPLMLARLSPTIWVFGWENKDFEAVDRGGYGTGGKQLPAGLTQAIAERVPADAAAWAATNDEQWAEKPGVKALLLLSGKKDWLPVLAKGRSGIFALSLGVPPRLRLFIKTADEKTGQNLRTIFQQMATTDDKVRHGGSGELAFFDAPFDPKNGLANLSRLLEIDKKP